MPIVLKRATPLYHQKLRKAPAHPLGDRVFVRPFAAESESAGGIVVPDSAKKRNFAGVLVAVGDKAADKLWDLGVEIGDEIWYGQYAGLIEQWDHIIKDGKGDCPHDGRWDLVGRDRKEWSLVHRPDPDMQLRECGQCGALKLSESIIIMSVDDCTCDVDLLVRLETGDMRRERATDTEGRTRYVIERGEKRKDSFEYGSK